MREVTPSTSLQRFVIFLQQQGILPQSKDQSKKSLHLFYVDAPWF